MFSSSHPRIIRVWLALPPLYRLRLLSLCRPYLAIQLSAARGQILEWAARGAGLDARTATLNSFQTKEGLGL